MVAPLPSYVQIFQNYDKAFVDKLGTVKFNTVNAHGDLSSKPLIRVFASPQRAFSQVAKQMLRKQGINRPTREQLAEAQRVIPLPIASVNRLGGYSDLNRFIQADMSNLAYNTSTGKYVGTNRPLPYTFPFQVDVWSRNRFTADDLANQMFLWLRATEFWLEVDHPIPIGDINVMFELVSYTDKSALESQTEERLIRFTFTFNCFGWLVYPMEEHGIVESIHIDYYDELNYNMFLEGTVTTEDEYSVVRTEPVYT